MVAPNTGVGTEALPYIKSKPINIVGANPLWLPKPPVVAQNTANIEKFRFRQTQSCQQNLK